MDVSGVDIISSLGRALRFYSGASWLWISAKGFQHAKFRIRRQGLTERGIAIARRFGMTESLGTTDSLTPQPFRVVI